jgi:hypothetical protein
MVGNYGGKIGWEILVGCKIWLEIMVRNYGEKLWWEIMVGNYGEKLWWENRVGK